MLSTPLSLPVWLLALWSQRPAESEAADTWSSKWAIREAS